MNAVLPSLGETFMGRPASTVSNAPALVDAFREQMGLSSRVERDQPIRRIVVEHIGPLVEN